MGFDLDDKWTLLTCMPNQIVASILKAFFETNEMPVVLVNKSDHAYPMMGDIEVYVPTDSFHTADALLTLFKEHE